MATIAWIAALLLVAAGLIGVLLPALPGSIFVFVGLVLAAWADGFTRVGGGTIALLALLTASTYAVDFAASAVGARRFGASRWAMLGAAIGALVGLFFGVPGIVIGPFAGAVLGELLVRRDVRGAGRAGLGAWLGILLGTATKAAIVLVMIGIFALAYLR